MSAPQLTDFIQGQGTVSGDQLNTFMQTCDNVAQLRAFIGSTGLEVSVRGISTPGDGGAGDFYWNATATGTDNNYSFIVPQGGVAGAWVRLPVLTTATNFYAKDTGAVNAMVAIYNPVIASYSDGMILYVLPKYTSTGPATFNAGGGSLAVVGPVGALQGGEIIARQTAGFQYSATNDNWLMISGWGATQGKDATESHQFVTLEQLNGDGGAAALNGSATEVFNVAQATTPTEAPELAQIVGAGGTVLNDVTGSRTSNTPYTNSAIRPLYVKVYAAAAGDSGHTLGFIINGITLQPDIGQGGSDAGFPVSASILVPPGATYEVTGGLTITQWLEY